MKNNSLHMFVLISFLFIYFFTFESFESVMKPERNEDHL